MAPGPGETPVPGAAASRPMAGILLCGMSENGMKTTLPADSAIFRGTSSDTQILRQVLTKVVIQEIPTRLYLSVGDFWTLEIEDATVFDSHSAALAQARNLKLENVQLVVSRVTKEWEIIPVEAGGRLPRMQAAPGPYQLRR